VPVAPAPCARPPRPPAARGAARHEAAAPGIAHRPKCEVSFESQSRLVMLHLPEHTGARAVELLDDVGVRRGLTKFAEHAASRRIVSRSRAAEEVLVRDRDGRSAAPGSPFARRASRGARRRSWRASSTVTCTSGRCGKSLGPPPRARAAPSAPGGRGGRQAHARPGRESGNDTGGSIR